MRKHYLLNNHYSNDIPQCTSSLYSQDTPCQYTDQGLSYSSGSNTFKYVEFISCSASYDHGGAIKCTGGTLEVLSSLFSSCTANNNNGGAIYAYSLSLLFITNTLFHSCGGSYDVISGGAIALSYVSSMRIYENYFLKCYSADDSGAIDMRDCGTEQNELPIQSSCFIKCECFYGDGPSAGALEGRGNNCGYFSSALFSNCKSDVGGALFLDPSFYINSICFSLFTGNSATDDQGMDVYIRDNFNQVNIFFYSFSTTSSIQVFDEATWEYKPGRLPQGIVTCAQERYHCDRQNNKHNHTLIFISYSLNRHLLRHSLFRPHR